MKSLNVVALTVVGVSLLGGASSGSENRYVMTKGIPSRLHYANSSLVDTAYSHQRPQLVATNIDSMSTSDCADANDMSEFLLGQKGLYPVDQDSVAFGRSFYGVDDCAYTGGPNGLAVFCGYEIKAGQDFEEIVDAQGSYLSTTVETFNKCVDGKITVLKSEYGPHHFGQRVDYKYSDTELSAEFIGYITDSKEYKVFFEIYVALPQ